MRESSVRIYGIEVRLYRSVVGTRSPWLIAGTVPNRRREIGSGDEVLSFSGRITIQILTIGRLSAI